MFVTMLDCAYSASRDAGTRYLVGIAGVFQHVVAQWEQAQVEATS
jgi:hypothetical protein